MLVQNSQLAHVLSQLMAATDKLTVQYENLLAHEIARADRIVAIGDFLPNPPAAGSVTLTNKINQPTLITSILYCAPASPGVYTLKLGRETLTRVNRADNLINVKFFLGPADPISLSWTGATSQDTASLYLFGELIGSKFVN